MEAKIRHLCSKVFNTEWSGNLFYKMTGTFADNNIEITCVDILPMDIGSSAYTEFEMSPEVATYMVENPELLDCKMGLIHSHQSFGTFFSGTDTATLQSEGKHRNHFLSLIINNAGVYTAAITRKKIVKKDIVEMPRLELGTSYILVLNPMFQKGVELIIAKQALYQLSYIPRSLDSGQ